MRQESIEEGGKSRWISGLGGLAENGETLYGWNEMEQNMTLVLCNKQN